MSTETTSDEELLARIAQGDRAAFAELFDRHAAKIKGIILTITGDFSEADDVVQETFYYVWTSAKHYTTARGKPLAWMAMLARSRALDALRRRKRVHTSGGAEEADSLAADDAAPLTTAVHAEISQRLRIAVARLPAEQGDLILKSFLQGLNHEELAQQTRLPLGTVKTRIRRGIMQLREILGPSESFAL